MDLEPKSHLGRSSPEVYSANIEDIPSQELSRHWNIIENCLLAHFKENRLQLVPFVIKKKYLK